MSTRDPDFRPLSRRDGYLPLEDHGLIGDGKTAALVARDGAVAWLCVPRFDSPALFCGLLDRRRGGEFRVTPDDLVESRQSYDTDTGVLVTDLRSRDGLVRVTDALALDSEADLSSNGDPARGRLVRHLRVLDGSARVRIRIRPRAGTDVEVTADGLRAEWHGQDLRVRSDLRLEPDSAHDLSAGDVAQITLAWGGDPRDASTSAEQVLDQTRAAWRRWLRSFTYEGPRAALVRRSAITLKLLDHVPNGAIVAAPTSSLPETIGGERNWDYRYTWIRDAAFSVYALRRIGLQQEATDFLAWVLDTVERADRIEVMYDLDGAPPPAERIDEELEGYRGSSPVRWGNAAAGQQQHDVYGEVLDCAFQWAARDGRIDPTRWATLRPLVEAAGREWDQGDRGIWEIRTSGRPFTYSAALCQVALDRGARLAERFGLAGDAAGWRRAADRIVESILSDAWDEEAGALTEALGGGALDASVLTLPLRRVLPADHPRMVATTEAVARRLGAGDGLLYRYDPERSPDGLEGEEGAFLLCSFWLVDNLAKQGRLDEATDLYDSLCDRANPLGLLPEQIEPGTGAFLGNYPQAFSHVGVVSSGVGLGRRHAERGAGVPPGTSAGADASHRAFSTATESLPPPRSRDGRPRAR